MDIYEAIADFTEERLQRQLQLSIEKAMRKGSVKYKEGQHLINISVINGENKQQPSASINIKGSPLKKIIDDNLSCSSMRVISKSIDSGVCIDNRDTEEEEESEVEFDDVASSDDNEHTTHTPRQLIKRQTSYTSSKPAFNKSSYFIKSKSLTRRSKRREDQYDACEDSTGVTGVDSGPASFDIMTRSVMGSLEGSGDDGGWNDSSTKSSRRISVHRARSKDALLDDVSLESKSTPLNGLSKLSRTGSRDTVLKNSTKSAKNPLLGRKTALQLGFKAQRPLPDICKSDTTLAKPISKGVLLLPVRKGDILGVVEGGSSGVSWWAMYDLRRGEVGYIHKNFLKFVEHRTRMWFVGNLLKSSRAVHMRSLEALHKATSIHTHPDVVYGAMIPDPDYSDEENHNNKQQATTKSKKSQPPSVLPFATSSPNHTQANQPPNMVARNNRVNTSSPPPPASTPSPTKAAPPSPQQKENKNSGRFDENGLVLPKKVMNPNMDSSDKKNLHREIKFNQKAGISVLNQKSELQKAMEKHKDKQIAKDKEKEKKETLTPFQKVLEQQAMKLEQTADKVEETKKESDATHEFQKLHAKLRAKQETQ